MKTALIKILCISFTIVFIVGCVSVIPTPLQKLSTPDAISVTREPVSRGCKWLGRVSVTDSQRTMLYSFQHALAEIDEIAALREQAFKLGANTIYLSKYQMIKKEKYSKYHEKQVEGTHVLTGAAYLCQAI